MWLRRVVLAALVSSVAVSAGQPGEAGASAFTAGEFKVTMSSSVMKRPEARPDLMMCDVGSQRMNISDYFTNVIRPWKPVLQGQPAPVSCTQTLETLLTNQLLDGTVTNAVVGGGTIAQACDLKRVLTTGFTLTTTMGTAPGIPPTFSVTNVNVKLDGYQACTWAMAFGSGGTKLSGTIEQVFAFKNDAASVPCPSEYDALRAQGLHSCVEVGTSAKVFVTGGAGEFEAATGTGTFDSTSIATFIFPFLVNQSPPTQKSSFPAAVTTFAALQVPVSSLAAAGDGLRLNLKKSPGLGVRLVAPTKIGGRRSLGVGPDGKTLLAVKFSSAPGSTCDVSTSSGSREAVVWKAKRDADGAVTTNITSRLLGKKLGVKKGAKVAVSVTCRAGAKVGSTSQVVTIAA